MITEVKKLRVEIDGLFQSLSLLHEGNQVLSWEVANSINSLKMAKAWAGKILGALGEKSPYPKDGSRHTVDDIEPTADSSIPTDFVFQTNETKPLGAAVQQLNYIERVDILRQMIGELSTIALDIVGNPEMPSFFAEMVVKYLMEARFWLGFDLQRIKEHE